MAAPAQLESPHNSKDPAQPKEDVFFIRKRNIECKVWRWEQSICVPRKEVGTETQRKNGIYETRVGRTQASGFVSGSQ